jgi:hypothetical protein
MNPSLLQGLTYVNRDKYNPKIVTKEWFNNMQSKEKCSSSDIEKNIQALLSQYQTKADEIRSLQDQYKKQTNNVYLNKNVQFSDGTYAYVTKSGIVKKYENLAMLQKNANLNGCPPPASITVSISWSSAYDVPGASIQMPSSLDSVKGPILKTGSPMVAGQSCGFEGTDVMVTQENDTPVSRYIGCYDYKEGQMSYLNNIEPYQNFIANQSFTNPFSVNNIKTNQTLTPTNNLLDNWTTSSTATIVNASNTNKVASSSNLIYPTPYPNASICVSLNGTQDISQVINSSLTGGKYTLSFSACGYSSANPINILVNKVSIFVGSSYLVPNYAWQTYSYTITLPSSTNLTLSFQGTDTVSGSSKYSAITNIRLTNGTTTSSPMFSFQSCQNIAKASPSTFPYFGFQAASGRTDGMGFCSVNSDSTGSFLSNFTAASQLGPQKILSSGTTTAPNIGVSAGITQTALLVVYTSSAKSSYVQVSKNGGLPPNTKNTPYLQLSDDGIMRIYATGDPTASKQGELLWSSIAPSVPVYPNADYQASKGATGKNYLLPANLLMPGQFVGSPNGSCYLKMETTGDLVLYTSTYASGCQRNPNNNNMEGTLNSSAIYKVNTATDNLFTNLGKLFFVSPDSKLQTFETDKLKMSSTYQKIANYNNPGTSFNLNGDMSSFNTLNKCKAACDANTNCFGYSFTSSSNSCQLKGSNLNADVGSNSVPGTDLYVRQQERSASSQTTNQVGSTRKQNYVPGSTYKPEDYPNASAAVEMKKQELAAIQDKISEAVEQLQQCSGSSGSSSSNQQMIDILNQIQKVRNDIQKKGTSASTGQTPNLDNMVEDTSFRVSQDSDKYLMWGLLGAATILLSVGVSKL